MDETTCRNLLGSWPTPHLACKLKDLKALDYVPGEGGIFAQFVYHIQSVPLDESREWRMYEVNQTA
jgi:hypothetical protein